MPPPAADRQTPVPATVDVWRIRLDQLTDDDAVLSDAERARAAGIRHAPTRRQFVLTRAAVRHILAGYLDTPAAAVPLVQRCSACGGPHGRPWLGSPSPLQLGIAHSGGWAVLAVGTGRPAGVDVESGDGPGSLAAGRRFSPEEQAALRAVADDAGRRALFLRIWTRKEAYLKATGDGLTRPLSSFAVSTGERAELLWADGDEAARWRLRDLPFPSPAVGAVALPAGHRLRLLDL